MGLLIPHPVEWPDPIPRPGLSQSPCLGPPGTGGILFRLSDPRPSYLEAWGRASRLGFDRPQGFEDPGLLDKNLYFQKPFLLHFAWVH